MRHWSQTTQSTGVITWHQPKKNAQNSQNGEIPQSYQQHFASSLIPLKWVANKNWLGLPKMGYHGKFANKKKTPKKHHSWRYTEPEDLRCFAARHWAPTSTFCLLGWSFKQKKGKTPRSKVKRIWNSTISQFLFDPCLMLNVNYFKKSHTILFASIKFHVT